MKKYILLILIVFASSNSEAEQIVIDLNASVFRLDESSTRWELYYAFPENILSYIQDEDSYVGSLNFSIEISSSIKKEVTDEWSINHRVLQPPDSFKQKLYGQRAFKLPYGQYQALLTITDPNNLKGQKKVSFPIVVKKFNNDRLEMSDILLSNLIAHEDDAGAYANPMFWKNGLYVYPNPSSEFYGTDPVLKLYTEIYNAESINAGKLQLHYSIYDGASREVFYYPKELKSISDGIVEVIEIPLSALHTGVYNLVLSVKAENSKDSIFKNAKFFLYNFELPPALDINFSESLEFERSEFATLSPERIELEYRRVRMIADKPEREQFAILTDPKAKARFMYLFWKKRNDDTISPVNNALAKHRERIDYANTFFSYGRTDNGWDTDRGHVLLKYGEPTRRDFSPHKGDERQYESWFYGEIEGGVMFYFVDVGGFGDFKLVHSTKQNEFYNPDWYNIYVPITRQNNLFKQSEYDGYR